MIASCYIDTNNKIRRIDDHNVVVHDKNIKPKKIFNKIILMSDNNIYYATDIDNDIHAAKNNNCGQIENIHYYDSEAGLVESVAKIDNKLYDVHQRVTFSLLLSKKPILPYHNVNQIICKINDTIFFLDTDYNLCRYCRLTSVLNHIDTNVNNLLFVKIDKNDLELETVLVYIKGNTIYSAHYDKYNQNNILFSTSCNFEIKKKISSYILDTDGNIHVIIYDEKLFVIKPINKLNMYIIDDIILVGLPIVPNIYFLTNTKQLVDIDGNNYLSNCTFEQAKSVTKSARNNVLNADIQIKLSN